MAGLEQSRCTVCGRFISLNSPHTVKYKDNYYHGRCDKLTAIKEMHKLEKAFVKFAEECADKIFGKW